jgi:hypothetical protein
MKHIGRKFYHLVGGVGLLSLYFILGRNQALSIYAILFVVVLALDVARLKLPGLNRFVYSRFGGFIRNNEKQKLTGTAPYIFGIGFSLYAFPAELRRLSAFLPLAMLRQRRSESGTAKRRSGGKASRVLRHSSSRGCSWGWSFCPWRACGSLPGSWPPAP